MENQEKVKTVEFDPAKYLGSPDAQAFFFSDALATGNRAYIVEALGILARARGMSQLARETGIKRETLYATLGPNGNPTLETLLPIITALGIQLAAEAKAQEEARQPESAA
jgi:probable addiction module antidote protein